VAGLLIGAFVIRPPLRNARLWLRRAYAAALIVLFVFLSATVAVDWSRLQTTQQFIYVALIALAAFMVSRVILSFRVAQRQAGGWESRYMNHVYFTYISLWEGLFIVGLIDLGAPGWLVAAVAIGVLVLGAVLFGNYSRRILRTPEPA
jgi:hypothetical protein